MGIHHVIDRSRELESEFAGQERQSEGTLKDHKGNMDKWRTDPSSSTLRQRKAALAATPNHGQTTIRVFDSSRSNAEVADRLRRPGRSRPRNTARTIRPRSADSARADRPPDHAAEPPGIAAPRR